MQKNAQLPLDLRPTIFTPCTHPKTDQVSARVGVFFITHWPFKNDEPKERFLKDCYTLVACINCPLSLDERLHFGCRLLTINFLIDDMLESISVEERVFHQNMLVESARGTFQPNENAPVQQRTMYCLFRDMREVDAELADKLLGATIDFLVTQAHIPRKTPTNLKDYLEYRSAKLGKG